MQTAVAASRNVTARHGINALCSRRVLLLTVIPIALACSSACEDIPAAPRDAGSADAAAAKLDAAASDATAPLRPARTFRLDQQDAQTSADSSAAGAEADASTGPTPWQPLAPGALFEGRPLREWAEAWMRWSNAPTDCEQVPAYDEDGSLCDRYQDADSPVFIFQTGFEDTVRSKCTVPAGKALLVPLVGYFIDNVGRDAPLTDTELALEAGEVAKSVRDLSLTIDGQAQTLPLDAWKVGPTRSDYDLPSGTNVYSCAGLQGVTGNISPAFYGGAFVLFPAPEPGTHSLEYAGTVTGFGDDFVSVVRATFEVQ